MNEISDQTIDLADKITPEATGAIAPDGPDRCWMSITA